MNGKLVKTGVIVLGAMILSTLGIFASDFISGVDRNLTGLVGHSQNALCPQNMATVNYGEHSYCIDKFEASAGDSCPHTNPKSTIESEANVNDSNCYADVREDALPWRFISLPQAQRMCAQVGKRLPTNKEWYQASLGTNADSCTINQESAPKKTTLSDCKSSSDAYDMIGNVWEWVDETVVNRSLGDRALPLEGYVNSVDADGIAITTSSSTNDLYGKDYFWSKDEGTFGVIRGGFYGSGSDAGMYTMNASVPTSFASPGVGFRCVKSI